MPCSLSRATISHIFLIDGSAVSLNHETASEPHVPNNRIDLMRSRYVRFYCDFVRMSGSRLARMEN
jgi:hypothetical protein